MLPEFVTTADSMESDKERKQDEAAVSKLLKDITTGGLRRKRGAADDLDVSDEEDAIARRREVKRREFARMRRELLKDEAVGKIAEDKKKQAFLESIEDRDAIEDEEIPFTEVEQTEDMQSQTRSAEETTSQTDFPVVDDQLQRRRPLETSTADFINRRAPPHRPTSNKIGSVRRKPSTLAEIREHVSFLIDEANSQQGTPDLDGSEDDEQEAEAYVNLDRHLRQADEENEDPDEGLADFIVDDERPAFKKPQFPTARPQATERRTKANVVDRLSLLRQSASTSSATTSSGHTHTGSKLAFFTSRSSADNPSSLFKVPALLRRATTNSSFHSESGSKASATCVTERGAVENEKEMIRRAQGGRRSAINYYAKGRVEEREKVREGRVAKSADNKVKSLKGAGKERGKKAGFLGGLFGESSWE